MCVCVCVRVWFFGLLLSVMTRETYGYNNNQEKNEAENQKKKKKKNNNNNNRVQDTAIRWNFTTFVPRWHLLSMVYAQDGMHIQLQNPKDDVKRQLKVNIKKKVAHKCTVDNTTTATLLPQEEEEESVNGDNNNILDENVIKSTPSIQLLEEENVLLKYDNLDVITNRGCFQTWDKELVDQMTLFECMILSTTTTTTTVQDKE